MTEHPEISVTREGNIAVVEINRPPNNHVTVELMRGLADALHAIDEDRELRCTILAAAGKVFCAGADFSSSTPLGGGGAQNDTGQLYQEAVRLFSTKKPIVAAVQGAAVGAGLGLALVADFRIAAPEARFAANFVKLAFHPGFGITHTLPRVIGHQRASLMCLTGRRIKADEALQWGLVDEVVQIDELRSAAKKLAHEIAENAPLGVESTRKTLRQGLAEAVKAQTDTERVEQAILRKTKDFAEGIRAVAERRPGNFVGA